MNRTNIPYLDWTWNPITGCLPDYPCHDNCWARKMAVRLAANPSVEHRERYEDFGPAFWPERLDEVTRGKGGRVGVCWLGDMFALDTPEWFANQWQVFNAMQSSPQHTYLLLTKRPQNMASALCRWAAVALNAIPDNWWVGTSASTQAEFDERMKGLLPIPARARFVSLEPLLGPIDLSAEWGQGVGNLPIDRLKWVIVGGETGPGARPMRPGWVRSIRDQCVAVGVPFWFKGWGAWRYWERHGNEWRAPSGPVISQRQYDYAVTEQPGRWVHDTADLAYTRAPYAEDVLDGQRWNQLPEVDPRLVGAE